MPLSHFFFLISARVRLAVISSDKRRVAPRITDITCKFARRVCLLVDVFFVFHILIPSLPDPGRNDLLWNFHYLAVTHETRCNGARARERTERSYHGYKQERSRTNVTLGIVHIEIRAFPTVFRSEDARVSFAIGREPINRTPFCRVSRTVWFDLQRLVNCDPVVPSDEGILVSPECRNERSWTTIVIIWSTNLTRKSNQTF